MHGIRRPVHEKRLVGRIRPVMLQPVKRLLDQVLGQMVVVVMWRLDGGRVFVEPGLPLRRFACDEAVEIIESVSLFSLKPLLFRGLQHEPRCLDNMEA
ncbi:MAG: hypothetical protein ETSY2_38115 [Candidatus Entotheonella gemina]|uniref:Uncharacterized protein n=1 Tax=Candidatus Entotheonella gemina TaxID=1429439 RepID=W4LT92_9BACT|nr:MAG: hypothetical protein ETSY2_38115 [Candidatus Entotheonella gemina]